ncbi:protein-L-isoaspartate O-methyltransferase family protein [Robiginitomaculum antarcticum]|uniref:protein-L-isoaspartate O-methyltransferase family protein n=1 Tax=Robiginitomaculum antarcticum TaxID=437507 RepID=UPI00037AC654|nr:hypothetical protein [Robiginitomaculum antarcticum]
MNPAQMDLILRLRQKGIHDNNVLRAIESVPRDRFCAPEDAGRAYNEDMLPLPCATMMPPSFTLAVMLQSLRLARGDKILVIGEGSGYAAALCAKMSARSYLVQRYQRLLTRARTIFAACGIANVSQRHGDAQKGWAGQAPYDKILIAANVSHVPPALTVQIKAGGRIVAVVEGMITIIEGDTVTSLLPAEMPDLEPGRSKAL